MGILKDFEKRLEGAVEGFFARAFRSGLQPVELAKALQRYAQNYQQVGLDGIFVPNVYRFELAPDDHDRFSGFAESLQTELASVVRKTAAERGWRLQGPVRIELRRRDDVTVGTYELRGKVEAGAPAAAKAPASSAAVAAPPAGAAEPVHTSVMPRPAATTSSTGAVVTVAGTGVRHAISRQSLTIGRLPECDVTLDDPSVSRRHARIDRGDGVYQITDLNSTNGVRVNGSPVTNAALVDGDRLELGSVQLVFNVEA